MPKGKKEKKAQKETREYDEEHAMLLAHSAREKEKTHFERDRVRKECVWDDAAIYAGGCQNLLIS